MERGHEQPIATHGTDGEDARIAAHIEPHPLRPGAGEYRLRLELGGVPVYALIGALQPDVGNLAAVADDYDVPREAVEAAWAYYRLNRTAIDRRLAENRVA